MSRAAGLTNVDIIDFSLARFVNFESEISFPEEGGILQVENFGMHINASAQPRPPPAACCVLHAAARAPELLQGTDVPFKSAAWP